MLTLAVIAKNERDRLADCVASVTGAAQVLVLDSGSSDGTTALARDLGARVVETDWPGHVVQKNRALAMAGTPWVLSLDADERLCPVAARALNEALVDPGPYVGFGFARCSRWAGRYVRHGRWYPDRKVRAVRPDRARWVGDDPHDRLQVEGPVRWLPGHILHEPYRSFAEHRDTIARYSEISARALHRRGVRAGPVDAIARGALHFVDAVLLRLAFLDGWRGVALGVLGAWYAYRKWSLLRRMGA